MIRRYVLFSALAAILALAAFPPTAPSVAAAAGQIVASGDLILPEPPAMPGPGDSYTYFDPDIISPTCASSADPLGCTADEGAAILAEDAIFDAASPEMIADDGAVIDTSVFDDPSALGMASTTVIDSPLGSAALDSPSLDPWSLDPLLLDPSFFDPRSPSLDLSAMPAPMLDLAAAVDPAIVPSAAIDISLAPSAAAVRSMVRGFNTRQEADYFEFDGTRERFDAAWTKIAGTGVRVHRLAVYWWDVQCKGPTIWDFLKYHEVAKAAQLKNIRLILTPVGSPNWARRPLRKTRTAPEDPCLPLKRDGTPNGNSLGKFAHPDNFGAWRAFIRRLAVEFRQYNPAGYEIWNEQNSRNFWDVIGDDPAYISQEPSPAGWSHLYCEAVTQIDINNPGKAVGVGGLAVYRVNERTEGRIRNMRSSAFLQDAYTALARQRIRLSNGRSVRCATKPFDYVGYHPYASEYWEKAIKPASVGDTDAIKELRSVRGVMRNHLQGRRKVWNTEWGFPSDFAGITEARQAALIREEHNLLANARDRYGFYMVFSIMFNPIDAPSDPTSDNVFNHVGVVALGQPPEDPKQWRDKASYATWKGLR